MTARKIILLCLAIIYPNPVKSTSSTEAETDQTTREATTTEDTTTTISSNTVTTNILSSTSSAATTTPTVTIPQSTSTILSSTSEVTTKISTAMYLTSSTREPTTTEDITETSTTSPLETMTSVTTATGTFSTSAYSTSSDTSHMTSDPSDTSHMTSDPSVTSTGTETSLSSASSSSAESTNFLYTTTAFETTTSSPHTISEDTTMTSALTTTALETTSAPTTNTEETTTSDPITTTEETATTSDPKTTIEETTTSAPKTTTEETTTTSAPTTTTEETTTINAPITATEETTTTSTNITTAKETTTTSTHTTTAVTSTTNVYFITVKPTVALSFSTKYNDTRFNETLYVTSSPYFKEISKVYKEKLTSVYNKSSGFHSLEITNFKRGLIVEYKTKYEVRGISETILERDLNSTVFETLRNETDVDKEYLNTSFKADIDKAKVQFRVAAGQDPCQLDSVKEQCAGFPICNSLGADSTVTCSSPCLYLDCGSHGTCILNAHNISKAQCSCGEDDRYIYGGERCHQRAEKLSLKSEHIIAIAGGVGGGLILILLIALISTCCYQRNQNKKEEMDFLPMTLFNEDDVTSMQNHASKQDDGLKSRLKDGKDDRLDTFGSHENPAMSGRENHSAVKTLESLDTSKNVQTTDGGGKHYAAADHSYYTIADKESEMTPVYQPLGKHQFKESDVAQPPDQPRYSDEKAKPSYMSSNAWTARQAGPTSSDFSRSSSRHADEARARDVHQPAGKRNLSTPYATQPHNPPPVDYDDDSPKSNFTHVYDYIPVERISIRRPQLLK